MISNNNFGKLLYPIFHKIYGMEYKEYPQLYNQIFNVEPSAHAYEESLLLTGFGEVPEKAIGASVTYNDPAQGWTHRITHVTYGLGFKVDYTLLEDDKTNKVKQYPRALARSVRHTIETLSANVLNNAFSNSYTGGDGLELLSTAHLLKGGGTWQNEPTNSADLDETSFEQALIDISAWVDDQGLKVNAMPKKLIVTQNNMYMAEQLLGSNQTPFDANNSINPAKGKVSYIVNNFLTDTDAWFLTTDVPNGLTAYWRRKPVFTKDNDFDSDVAKFKVTFRFSVGWHDPRGLYGSEGA